MIESSTLRLLHIPHHTHPTHTHPDLGDSIANEAPPQVGVRKERVDESDERGGGGEKKEKLREVGEVGAGGVKDRGEGGIADREGDEKLAFICDNFCWSFMIKLKNHAGGEC